MATPTLLAPEPRRRPRRTQSQRRAEARERILAATVESLDQVGFQRTTAAEIARRSGLTWGAVQHHFGDKDGILGAVIEDSFRRFEEGLQRGFESLGTGASLDRRVGVFVDAAWAHFASAHYRAAFEILLEDSARRRAAPAETDEDLSWQTAILRAWTRVWQRLFPDVPLPRRRALMLQHFTISALSGLASLELLAGEPSPNIREELSLLRRTLVRELRASRTRAARASG